MNGYVEWIGAAADEAGPAKTLNAGVPFAQGDAQPVSAASAGSVPLQELVAHSFPAQVNAPAEVPYDDDPLDRNPDLWMYRNRTLALLRRYMRISIETGRLPSLIGRELFRAKVTSYTATSFEDRVIFVHDMEVCLERLPTFDQEIIARVVLQEYDHERAARVLHCTRKTIERKLPEILDGLSEAFLKVGMLVAVPATRKETP
jgi:hypothetical protein